MSHELPLPRTSRVAFTRAASDEHVLWIVTAPAFILGMLTTLYGLDQGLAEFDPVVLTLIPAFEPVGALIPLRLVALAVVVVAWRVLPSRYRGTIPIGAAVPWGIVGLVNTQLILVTVSG